MYFHFFPSLQLSIPPFQLNCILLPREEYLSQLAAEIQVQHEVPLFDLIQLERLAPYLPTGQDRVSLAVMRCLSAIRSSIASLHTVNVRICGS